MTTEEKNTKHFYMCWAPRAVGWELGKLKKKDKYWKIWYLWIINNLWKIDDSWEDIYALWFYKSEFGMYVRGKEDIKEVFDKIKEFDSEIQIVDWNNAEVLKEINLDNEESTNDWK